MIRTLSKISQTEKALVGGKAFSLACMMQKGVTVPPAICLDTDAYETFVSSSGLRERIFMELNRKKFEEMRWEEIWDTSLRLRNMFANTPMPALMRNELEQLVNSHFGDKPTVIRSSAPGEDSASTSFAGLHESYVNVRGIDSILKHIRLVWASLWSDRALLYRRELGLHIESSTMAVLIQELVAGERSGVAFCVNPNDDAQGIIEAVHGLNQGMVDGTVEPDRWIVERKTRKITSHVSARRKNAMFPSSEGVRLKSLPSDVSSRPPLSRAEVKTVFALAQKMEELFNSPQDVEWTYSGESLYGLQSRPITTGSGNSKTDKRSWYQSLTRSFENLRKLRKRIENELIPAMIKEADKLAETDISGLTDTELASEIKRRMGILRKWQDVYEDEFIPFAHGARLFGQVYNDTVYPSDPYEFTDLLGGTDMKSVQRNEKLADMAEIIRNSPVLGQRLRDRSYEEGLDPEFSGLLDSFMKQFGEFTFAGTHSSRGKDGVIGLLIQMASRERTEKQFGSDKVQRLTEMFLSKFQGDKKDFASELLDLGRASYQLRDDDNIYIGRIESGVNAAAREGRKRINARQRITADMLEPGEEVDALLDPDFRPAERRASKKSEIEEKLKARQIVGQPASSGIARGEARIISDSSDLFNFKAGEILVCDSIDPNMTFIVPLAAGIVERRGGMLIHGAIVAREYGIPCVTGIPNATSMIQSGQEVTVDGFLGIVIIGKPVLS